jgi:uroporphyrinogen III methyltransferase/synthase
VNSTLLKNAPKTAKRIYVGKRGEGSSADQKLIEEQIVAEAKKGKKVVRLKGGDPFIFGRGGEEAERLAAENIPFEVVPGVTSPIAVPAYAGIPLTHRDFTQTVVFVTGHAKEEVGSCTPEAGYSNGKSGFNQDVSRFTFHPSPIDWTSLSKMGTIVFVMGVKTIRQNMESLMKAGKDPQTPVAVIRWGTLPKQRTILGKVGDIAETIESMGLMPPAVIVVGEVVGLHEKIDWFESKSLFGRKILVTRARVQAGELSRKLAELGAEVFELPTIEIMPPASWKEVDRALGRIKKYHWVLFTSVNGVEAFFCRLAFLKKDLRDLAGLRLGAVGEATAQALKNRGLQVDRIPEKFSGKDLALSFPKSSVLKKHILIPRAEEGREDLTQALKAKGALVHPVTVYVNRKPRDAKTKLKRLSEERRVDLIAFTSSSAVKNLTQLLHHSFRNKFLDIPCACIGPSTAETARKEGFKTITRSKKASLDALVKTIAEYFNSSR